MEAVRGVHPTVLIVVYNVIVIGAVKVPSGRVARSSARAVLAAI
jgi:hypothetical protein